LLSQQEAHPVGQRQSQQTTRHFTGFLTSQS